MFLSEEVCGASREASSNIEPAEVSRGHSSRDLKARWSWRRAALDLWSLCSAKNLTKRATTLDYPMKDEKQKTMESCPQNDSAEREGYEGAQTLIGMVGDDLVEVQLTTDRMLEYILTPDRSTFGRLPEQEP